MKISQSAKNAIYIGSLCSVSYFAVYIVRNILSAVTPQMVEKGFTEEYIGGVSSLFLLFYACGQLVNGIIGDKIRAKWMLAIGLFGAAVTNVLFAYLTHLPTVSTVVYGMAGYFLAMIYGPMTKVVSENTEPVHAARCSLGYNFASLVGSPAAGILAMFLAWQTVFSVSSAILVLMAVCVFACFTRFERRGIVRYGRFEPEHTGLDNIRVLLKRKIVKYTWISMITGVVRTSVVFWLPTYLSQYLGYSSKEAASIFSVTSLIIAVTSFAAVFICEALGNDMEKTVLLMFSVAAMSFLATYFVQSPVWNIAFLVLAIMASGGAATMLWGLYCPSLRDTGMVSSATGFLDFVSYAAAALANLLFANAATTIGWGNLILVWLGLMIVGVVISLPYDKWKRKNA